MDHRLLTLSEAAARLRLKNGASFSRFARRYFIPLVRIGRRVVRIRESDLDRFLQDHSTPGSAPASQGCRKTSIPVLEDEWHRFHGSSKVQGGRLKATTDSDYVRWTCPGCHDELAGGAGIKFLGSHSDLDDPEENPHALVFLIHCPACDFVDHFKIPVDQFEFYGTGKGIEG